MALHLRIKYFFAVSLFFIAGVFALIKDEPALIAVPVLAVSLPFIYTLLVNKPEYIFYTLIALLPLSTEFNLTPSLGLDLPDELFMMLLTGIFIFKCCLSPSVVPSKFINHPIFLLLLLHLLWIVISIIFSMDPLLSLKFLLAKTWHIVPFVILPYYFLNSKKSLKLFSLLLLIPMAVVVIQALIRHSLFGFSFESVKEIYHPFFRNHVNFSGMLACLLPVLYTLYKLTDIKWLKNIIILLFLFGLAAVVLAYSRGAWLALIAGIAGYYLIKSSLIKWSIIIATSAFVIIGTWLLYQNNYLRFSPDYNTTVFHENFNEHLEATVQFKDVSNAERFYRWIAGINMVAEKPITGFGPNNFYNHYKSYTETPFKTWVSNNPEHSSVHNYFILTAIEQGLPGLIIFCTLFFTMIIYSQRLYHSLHDIFYKKVAITAGVILIMIAVLIFMSDLIETDKIGSLFWLCAGILIMLGLKRDNELKADHQS